MIRLGMAASAATLIVAMSACADPFKAEGDPRLVGHWECTEPNIIINTPNVSVEIAMSYRADGTNTASMKLKGPGPLGTMSETEYIISSLYRVEATSLIEKETSTRVKSFSVDGEAQPDWALKELEADSQDDVGKIITSTLKVVSENEIILDEASDNVICTRISVSKVEDAG